MAKGAPGSPPNLIAGQRQRRGDVSGLGNFSIQEVRGGDGVTVKQFGKKLIVSARPARGGSRSGSAVPRLVATLPAITEAYDVVTWVGSDYTVGGVTGTGDNQVWEVDGRVGQTKWTPRQFITSKSGVPIP